MEAFFSELIEKKRCGSFLRGAFALHKNNISPGFRQAFFLMSRAAQKDEKAVPLQIPCGSAILLTGKGAEVRGDFGAFFAEEGNE